MRALFSLAPDRNDNETSRCIRPPNKVFVSKRILPILVLFGSRWRLLSLHHESDRFNWQISIKLSIIEPKPIPPLSALSLLLLSTELNSAQFNCFLSATTLLNASLLSSIKVVLKSQTERDICCVHSRRMSRSPRQVTRFGLISIDSFINLCAKWTSLVTTSPSSAEIFFVKPFL